jgi:hypothetical protein
MPQPIRQPVRNIDKVQAFLREVPRGTVKPALNAIAVYLIGDERHGLRHSPPYKYVSRARAYGQVSDAPPGYFSWKQFRYVMAKIASGEITPGVPQRTGETGAAYGYHETNNGYGVTIDNPKTSAYYTQHDTGQARQPALVGWRKVSKNIQDNIKGALHNGMLAINRWLKEKAK